MSILNDIRACLDNHLINTANLPTLAMENVPYTQSPGTSFIKVNFAPTLRRPKTMGNNPSLLYQGIYPLVIYTPENTGIGAGLTYADIILDSFKATTDISYTNPNTSVTTYVTISYSEVVASFLNPPFYHTPVNIGWYLYSYQ